MRLPLFAFLGFSHSSTYNEDMLEQLIHLYREKYGGN
jgi:hypothetical protein